MPDSRAPGGPPGMLAIIAGQGQLPELVVAARRAAGLGYLLVTFPGYRAPWMAGHPHQDHRFEKVGALFAALRRAGVSHLMFAGVIHRPRLAYWRLDLGALRVLWRVLGLLRRGDDGLLRGLARIFEAEGFTFIGPNDVLGGLTVGAGLLGRHRPDARDRADAARAAAILAALAPHDVGQAVVVAGGLCLGVEAIEGTDALLARVASLPAERRRLSPPPSGVLVKLPKTDQDRRIDLPTIGPGTVAGAQAAGLGGIVIEADGVNVLDRAATIAAADAAGLFLWCARLDQLRPVP